MGTVKGPAPTPLNAVDAGPPLAQTAEAAMNEFVQVMTTTQRKEDAQRIAEVLVEKRLAACVQIVGPITSLFRWQGQIESVEEWQCHIKTRAALYEDVEREVRANHPYEVPEILALPIVAGSRDYLAWLRE